MKTILVLIPVIFAVEAMSQNTAKPESLKMAQEIQIGDSVLLKEGNVWLIKDGKRTVVVNEVIIGGTKVKSNGTVIFKDGSTTTMQEGDVILADGKLVRAIIKVNLEEPKRKKQQYE